jgi:hypothetical protein
MCRCARTPTANRSATARPMRRAPCILGHNACTGAKRVRACAVRRVWVSEVAPTWYVCGGGVCVRQVPGRRPRKFSPRGAERTDPEKPHTYTHTVATRAGDRHRRAQQSIARWSVTKEVLQVESVWPHSGETPPHPREGATPPQPALSLIAPRQSCDGGRNFTRHTRAAIPRVVVRLHAGHARAAMLSHGANWNAIRDPGHLHFRQAPNGLRVALCS